MNRQGIYLRVVDEVNASVRDALGEGEHALGREAAALALLSADLKIQVSDADEDMALVSTELELTTGALRSAALALRDAGMKIESDRAQYLRERIQIAGQHDEDVAELRASYEKRILDLENVKGAPKRNGKPWSEFEEKTLVKYYRLGKTEAELARRLGRYCDAVCVRLGKIHTGDTWKRHSGEPESKWVQRMRAYYFGQFTGSFNTLLWHKDVTPVERYPAHIYEAFDEVPESLRTATGL